MNLFCVNGRWLTMATANRCLHHVSLSESCVVCAEVSASVAGVLAPKPATVDLAAFSAPPVVEAAPVVIEAADPLPDPLPEPTPPQRPALKKTGRK